MLAGQVLLLIALGLFLAIGLEPAVSWLIDHRFPRWAAVLAVFGGLLLLLAGFIAAAIPALVDQGGRLIQEVPQYVAQLSDSSTAIGQLNERFHIQDTVQQIVSGGGPGLATGVINVGEAVFGAFSALLVVGRTDRLLPGGHAAGAGHPVPVRAGAAPAAGDPAGRPDHGQGRRVRAGQRGDLGDLRGGHVRLADAFGVPYPLLLAILFALLDLVPVIGSLVAGALVALAAFSVSVQVGVATIAYFVAYKLVEDYLLSPKVFGRVLRMPRWSRCARFSSAAPCSDWSAR